MSVTPSSSPSSPSSASSTAPVTSLEGGAVRIQPANGRATPKGPTFKSVLAQAKPLLKGAEAAASVLPGGPLLAAAVKGAPTSAPMSGAAPTGGKPVASGVPMVPNATTGGVVPSVGAAGAAGAGTAEGGGVEAMLAESQAFNLYYLQLQEEVSAENRSYTTLSNVLKARHDTVKNAIGNIR